MPPRRLIAPLAAFLCAGALWLTAGWFSSEKAWDFSQFFVAAHLPMAELYDRVFAENSARELLAKANSPYLPPYVRPAVFALPLRLMHPLSYWNAFAAWVLLQLFALGISIYSLERAMGWKAWALAAAGFSYPVYFGITTGQDGAILLACASVGLLLLNRGRDTLAGIAFGLLLYKFNLYLLVPFAIAASGRWRALRGMAVTVAVAGLASALLAPTSQYVDLLRHIDRYTIGFTSQQMIGWRGFAAKLAVPALYPMLALATLAICFLVMRTKNLERCLCAAILAGLLCAWHVNYYDAAVLLLPLAVAAARGWRVSMISLGLMCVPVFWIGPMAATVPVLMAAALMGLLPYFAPEPSAKVSPR